MIETSLNAYSKNVYKDILERTGGDIYFGVVGPVRTGKSTFIKELMEQIVLPFVPPSTKLDRMKDELPQAGSGKQVTTAQPHFVPSDGAVNVLFKENLPASVRFVDSVGYPVQGAEGILENGHVRMLKTPWQKEEMTFYDAAQLGTDKVIKEHANIGIVMTTDGSIVDIKRSQYKHAEEKIIEQLKKENKPFIILLNSKHKDDAETIQLARNLSAQYNKEVTPINALDLKKEDIENIFSQILLSFPIVKLHASLPPFVSALNCTHPLVKELIDIFKNASSNFTTLHDKTDFLNFLLSHPLIKDIQNEKMDFGKGEFSFHVLLREGLFNEILSEQCHVDVTNEKELLALLTELVAAKTQYDMLKDAISSAENTGYGLVPPKMADLSLKAPVISKEGTQYGVTLEGEANVLHIVKSPVSCKISPVLGNKEQAQEYIKTLLALYEKDLLSLWETCFFGRSLRMLMEDAMTRKLTSLPPDIKEKISNALTRMLNEGEGGMVLILL